MTLAQLAARLNVSPASVSIVRQGRPGVSDATRRRIQSALKANGYSYLPYAPEQSAPAGKHDGSPQYIRLLKYYRSALLTDKNEGFVDAIIDAIDAIARTRNYKLVFSSLSSNEFDQRLPELAEESCIGLLVIATEMEREEIEKLRILRTPVVVLDCDHPALPFSSVTMNNRDLAYAAVARLRSLGEVGYLCSSIRTGNFKARGNGYREALHDFGLPEREELCFSVTPVLNTACEDMNRLLDAGRRLPPALFADNDVIAIGAMRAMQAHGYRLPQDVNIIGVDNTMLSQICTPTLSSIQISCAALGEQAIQLLLNQIADPSGVQLHIHIGSRLIVRESTAGLNESTETQAQ
mgnify:FL=1